MLLGKVSEEVKAQREAITQSVNNARPNELESAICVGWVMVAEWIDNEGSRWLTRLDSSPDHKALPTWTRTGYLHDALFGSGWEDD